MIRLKICIVILSVLFCYEEGQAQPTHIDSLPQAAGQTRMYTPLPLHQLHVGVQVGTEFMTTSGYGSGLSTFLSPTLTYPVSKKFQLSGGLSIVNTSFYGLKPYFNPEGNSSTGYSGNLTQAMLWVSGRYLVGDRITITGTAYKTVDVLGNNPANTQLYKYNPQGAFLNVGYKINDYMHIEAGFGYSKGSNGYSYGYPSRYGFGSSDFNPYFNR